MGATGVSTAQNVFSATAVNTHPCSCCCLQGTARLQQALLIAGAAAASWSFSNTAGLRESNDGCNNQAYSGAAAACSHWEMCTCAG